MQTRKNISNFVCVFLSKFMKISGIQKLTLLDYPEHMAATIFTSGCNMRCPFCHNSSLVNVDKNAVFIDENDILDFLKKRVGKLDGICITGGEPLLQSDLIPFIKKVKELGFKVKLDTNGYLFDKLKEILDLNIVDYVAMDIKNSLTKYPLTAGLNSMIIENISKSIELLKSSNIDYEFRTTIVKELHNIEDIKEIATMLKGCEKYFLQQFEDTPYNLKQGYSAHDEKTLIEFKNYLNKEGIKTEIRGI